MVSVLATHCPTFFSILILILWTHRLFICCIQLENISDEALGVIAKQLEESGVFKKSKVCCLN